MIALASGLINKRKKCSDDEIFVQILQLPYYGWQLEKYQHYNLQVDKYICFHSVIKLEYCSCMNCILISQPMEDGKYNQ